MNAPLFYLVSTELREPYEPRACYLLQRIGTELQDDLALVHIEPLLPADIYESPADMDCLILVARHEGTSLFAIRAWPVPVYICTSKDFRAPNREMKSQDLRILDRGEVRPAKQR